ncbi:MAG: type I-C CRISPR-associated protein Cas5 [Acidobacteria bacterium]|nr:type I-C CRISPR-associated protein Cas5 [Acidobacteriota bacterium]
MNNNRITLRVWGDYACFTRPEMKVERVSYPVMTPSAARGMLEAVFWEPQICYLIDTIHVVKRGRWFSFRRNEVAKVIQLGSVKVWMEAPEKFKPIQADDPGSKIPPKRESTRAQRNMLALQEVEYLITAEVRPTELGKQQPLVKYFEEIKRRARSGKCFHRPALGAREFAADFEYEEDAVAAFARRRQELCASQQPYDEDLGLMLYDVFALNDRAIGFQWLPEEAALTDVRPAKGKGKPAAPRFAGVQAEPQAVFFHAAVKQDVLDCHPDRVRFARRNND